MNINCEINRESITSVHLYSVLYNVQYTVYATYIVQYRLHIKSYR